MNYTDKNWYKNALLVDRDEDWIWEIDPSSKAAAISSMVKFFSKWKGYNITDVLLCVFGQTASVPSKYLTWIGGKYPRKGENGIDYNNIFGRLSLEGLYRAYTEYEIDPVQIFIDVMNESGIRPWITLRMNDAHYLYDEISVFKSDMFCEELKAGHMIGDSYGYFGRCYDFSYPRIRQALLGYISEILEKYDFFGLDLDFMREIYCFDYKNNPDCHKIMTEFIRQIKALVKNAENRVGHPIKLMVRVTRSVRDSLEFGFDVKTWCEEGLIDAIEPTPRWECSDSGIPVREWREVIGENIALFPGVEKLHLKGFERDTNERKFAMTQPEQTKAYAAAWLAQGADGLYLANHCYGSEREHRTWMLDLRKICEGKRRFTVTFQDIVSGSIPRYKPLPLTVDGESGIIFEVGRINRTDSVKVIIDFEGNENPTLDFGDIKNATAKDIPPIIEAKEEGNGCVTMTLHRALEFSCDGYETDCAVKLTFKGHGTVHYIDIVIEN